MPSVQRGSVVRHGSGWSARYYDEHGNRRRKGGFQTRSVALEWLGRKLSAVDALRNGDIAATRRQDMLTLQALVDEYVSQHVCEPSTKAALEARLKKATATFGDVRLDRLAVSELRAWRATLPQGSAWNIVKCLRQALGYAVAVGLLDVNPAQAIPNPEPKRTKVLPFATLAEVEALSAELLPHYRAIPLLGCLTGLRPSELFGLERRDIDRAGKVLHVRRVLVGGAVRPYGKTVHALRIVPLAQRALDAIEAHPVRIDTPTLFTTRLGTPIDLHRWRARHWTPALRAAGLTHRGPYAWRHTYASWAIAAGLPTFEIATTMGTSLEMLSKTYGHLLPDAADRVRVALDAYINNAAEAAEGGAR
jgi:integrase